MGVLCTRRVATGATLGCSRVAPGRAARQNAWETRPFVPPGGDGAEADTPACRCLADAVAPGSFAEAAPVRRRPRLRHGALRVPRRPGTQALGWRFATDSGPRISHDTNPRGGPLRAGRHLSKSSSSSLLTLLPLVAIGLLGLLLLHPAPAAQGPGGPAVPGLGIEVGDEVQTVGGVIGTVLEVHGDRYTLLTGALGDDGNLDGPQPTRIVFVRQAIAKKIEPIEDVRVDDEPVQDVRPCQPIGNGTSDATDARRRHRRRRWGRRRQQRRPRWGGRRGVSPKSGGRAQRRQRRNLWISVLVVVAISVGSFAAVFAAKWSPRLGPRPRRRRVGRLHGRGAARLPGRPRRDGQHLEPPRQRARRVGRAGADDGQEPDLGLHSRRHRRAAGARPDRADGAHVLPPGASASAYPQARPEGLEDKPADRASGRSPPVRRRRS